MGPARASIRRELLPYAAIVLGALCIAIAATTASAAALERTSLSDGVQTVLVAGTYFLVYAVMFVFRFLLFDRLFATEGTEGTEGTEEAQPKG
jgi:Ca2+/H+ antiporter